MICPRCKDPIPEDKLACPACFARKSDEDYLDLQRRLLAAFPMEQLQKLQFNLIYMPGGKGFASLDSQWHIQRYNDSERAFCSADLTGHFRKQRESYQRMGRMLTLCARCKEILDGIVQSIAA